MQSTSSSPGNPVSFEDAAGSGTPVERAAQQENLAIRYERTHWVLNLLLGILFGAAGCALITYIVVDASQTPGELATTAVLVGAAMLIELLAVLFIWQANRARSAVMRMLGRAREDADAGTAIRLVSYIEDDALRAEVLAQLALHLSGVANETDLLQRLSEAAKEHEAQSVPSQG